MTTYTMHTERLLATIDDLQANVASLEQMIDELRRELRCRDIDELTGMHNLRWLREFWSGLHQPSTAIGAVAFLDVDLHPVDRPVLVKGPLPPVRSAPPTLLHEKAGPG